MSRRSAWRILALLLSLSLIAVACGGSDDEGAGGDDTTTTDSGSDDGGSDDDGSDDDGADDDATAGGGDVGVSLILKNTSNPFFVSMANSAQAEADAIGVNLTVAAGQEDGDTQSQIDAIEAAVARGDAGILITPSGDAVVPALEAAREAGLLTIALDTPPNPADAVDITFATDNFLAGQLIGEWTAAKLDGEPATIAMLDLFNDQVVSVDTARDQGFLAGMGIIDVADYDTSGNGNEPATGSYSGGDYEVVCHEPTNGAVDGGKTAMETCLALNPDINVVYTINEPAAQGAYDALVAAGAEAGVIIVSVDGGCSPGLELVSQGIIGATAQQYPGRMATLGMEAIKTLADGGAAPQVTQGLDFFNTGVALVADETFPGVDSISVAEGNQLCWGPSGETAADAALEDVGVSLILKNTSNPFFVSMANSAQAEADAIGVNLTVAAGQEDGDTQSQIDAIEAAVARGDAGILITPSGDAVVPALEAAREAGLLTIALDTPPNPADAVDITFATDNFLAGQLIGEWAAEQLAGDTAVIAMLDLFNDQVVSVDTARDQGFLAGMGIIDVADYDTSGNGNEPATGSYSGGDYEVVCHEPTNGAVDGGKTAMETCLALNPDINVVYTINEPAAQGAYDALVAAGAEAGVIIVSVDGGCSPGLELVADGIIGATAQQYPGRMATLGMEAIKTLATGGAAPAVSPGLDFFNTGVALVTDSAVDGVDSISVAEGNQLCWG